MRGTIIALVVAGAGFVGAGCLGRYNPPTDPPAQPPAKTQPAPSGPTQSPTPSPSPAPPQTPTPTPSSDGGAPPPAPTPPDGGTSSACAQLDSCCQQLPPDQIQGCLDQVAGLDENVCQGILDQLQSNGYCL